MMIEVVLKLRFSPYGAHATGAALAKRPCYPNVSYKTHFAALCAVKRAYRCCLVQVNLSWYSLSFFRL